MAVFVTRQDKKSVPLLSLSWQLNKKRRKSNKRHQKKENWHFDSDFPNLVLRQTALGELEDDGSAG